MKEDAYRPHGRPECLDSFLAEAAIVIDSERQRGLAVDQLARKMSKRKQDVANTFSAKTGVPSDRRRDELTF